MDDDKGSSIVTKKPPRPRPTTADELVAFQNELSRERPEPWALPAAGELIAGGAFVCFPLGRAGKGDRGDRAWAAAALVADDGRVETAIVEGVAGAPFESGLLALREGALLEAAVNALPAPPDVLLVDATGLDHPRRAGLALHLGAVLEVPTVGITRRTLRAHGPAPALSRGSISPLIADGVVVGHWVRTRSDAKPIAVHSGWRVDPATAVAVALRTTRRSRTPEPIRQARRVARLARATK